MIFEQRYTDNEIQNVGVLKPSTVVKSLSQQHIIPHYNNNQRTLLFNHSEYNTFSEKDYPTLNGSFTYNFRDFQPPEIANGLSGAARFGHSANFADAFGTDEEKADYIIGLLWLGIVVAIFFVCWLLIIILFYFLGPNRVGFLSGSSFYKSSNNNSNNENTATNTSSKVKSNETVVKSRTNDLNITKDTKASELQSSFDIHNEDFSIRDISFQHLPSTEFQNDDTLNDDDDINNKNNNNNSHSSFDAKLTELIIEENEKYSTKAGSIRQSNSERNGRWGSFCGIDQIMWIRGTFILSGIIVILFAILFVTQGLANFQRSVDTINTVADTTMYMASKASDLIRADTLAIHKDLAPLINDLRTELEADSICPNAVDNGQVVDILKKFRNVTSQALVFLNLFDAFITSNDFNDILSTLGSSHNMSKKVYDATNGIDLTDWQSLVVLVLYTPIPCLLVASAILSAYDTTYPRFRCFVVWVLFPAFFILTIVAAVFCSASIITASGNSDFCNPAQYNALNPDSLLPQLIIPARINITMNSPDVTVFQILQKLGVSMQSDMYIIASFYITQCFLRNPFATTEAYYVDLQDGKETFRQLLNNLVDTDTIEALSTLCGRDYDGLEKAVNDVQALVSVLVKSVRGLIDLIGCDKVVPIYQTAIYDASCQESLKAVMWIFSSSLIVATFGFLMITLRAAYSVTEYESTIIDDNNQKNVVLESDKEESDAQLMAANFVDNKPQIPLVASEDHYDTDDDNSSQNDFNPNKLYGTERRDNKSKEQYSIPNDEIVFTEWTPTFPSETKAVGDEIDRILDDLCKSRSYDTDNSFYENIEVRRTATPSR